MDKKTTFLFWIVIVILLALGLSMWNSFQTLPQSSGFPTKNPVTNASKKDYKFPEYSNEPLSLNDDATIQRLKNAEILGLTDKEIDNQMFQKGSKRDLAVKRYLGNDTKPNPNFYSKSHSTGSNSTNPFSKQNSLASKNGGNSISSQTKNTNFTTGPSSPLSSNSKQEKTPFSPYLANLNKNQAKALEQQLTGLSSKVERAVLQALLPKSKKDSNIEKYLQKNSTTSTAVNPFSSVVDQVASQRQGIVQSMKAAFGSKAANETNKIMDSFQKDLQNAISSPNLTPEQIAQKTREISNKYQQQLQKASEKYGKEKFEKEHESKDNALKEELANAYGDKIANLAEEKLAEYRQKELELASRTDLTAEEYYAQLLENQRERRKAIEQVLVENGQSLKGLQKAEDALEQQRVEQAIKDEEEGKVAPTSYKASESEKNAFNQSLQQERSEKIDLAKNMYGNTGAMLVNEIYNEYHATAAQIMDDPETSRTEKQQQLMQARQEANKKIEQLQNRPELKKARENNQVENTLANIMKDPGIARATPEQQEAFAEHARPILHDMFSKINEISANPQLSEEQKNQQIQAIQAEAQRLLSSN